jgi:hypothetical protein
LTKVLSILVSVGKWLRREFVEARPVFLFFLVGFLLLLLLIKLALANSSVEITALSKAVVGALLAAKAVLIIDGTPLERGLERYRRVVAIAVKTLIYGSITLLLGYLERVLGAHHRTHNLDAAAQYVIAQAGLDRLLAWALGISILYAIYFASYEVNRRLGEGKLWSLFFDSPKIPATPTGTRTSL